MGELLDFTDAAILLVLGTGFIKFVTVLSIFRYGLGLHGIGFGIVVVVLSAAIAQFVSQPYLEAENGTQPVELRAQLEPFLQKHSDPGLLERLSGLKEKMGPDAGEQADPLLLAFSLTELREAFILGLYFIIPFIIIDLFVVNGLLLLGAAGVSPLVFSLPIKLLLFVAVDGWGLIVESLLSGYFT